MTAAAAADRELEIVISAFQVLKLVPQSMVRLGDAFATTDLVRGPGTVKLKPAAANAIIGAR